MPAQATSGPTLVQDGAVYRPLVRRGTRFPGYWVGTNGWVLSQWKESRDPTTGHIRWVLGESPVRLAPTPIGKKGRYHGVALRLNGRTARASIHTLVMEAFVGPCPEGLEVCHGDGNGHNNWLGNLRYDTRPANARDRDGHATHQRGQQNPSAKLTDEQAEEIRRFRSAGMRLKDIAARFGVRESTVSRIANRVRRAR